MTLKTFKPYTKSTRGTILVDRTGLWKGKPFKALVTAKNSMKGRNNNGHITNINRAGGHKKMYRQIASNTVATDYWHKLDDGRIQCDLCPRFCKLHDGQRGLCFVRQNQQQQIVLTSYGRSSGFAIDPIEKKPFFTVSLESVH